MATTPDARQRYRAGLAMLADTQVMSWTND
jgi:hypothetical protein